MGDVWIVGVAVIRGVEATLAPAIMQGDLMFSCLVAAARHTLNTGYLHLGQAEEQGAQERCINTCFDPHSHFLPPPPPLLVQEDKRSD